MKIYTLKKKSKALEKFSEHEWAQADLEHYGKPIPRSVWKEKKLILKAVIGREIVGVLAGKLEAGVFYIGNLLVSHKHRGKGIGKQLIQKAEEWAQRNKAHKIHLVTGEGWDAVRFYESLGYRVRARLPKHHLKRTFLEIDKFLD